MRRKDRHHMIDWMVGPLMCQAVVNERSLSRSYPLLHKGATAGESSHGRLYYAIQPSWKVTGEKVMVHWMKAC